MNRKGLVCTIETGKRRGQRVVIPRVKLQSSTPVGARRACVHAEPAAVPCVPCLRDHDQQEPRPVARGRGALPSPARLCPRSAVRRPLPCGQPRLDQKVLVVNSREQGTFDDHDGVWTVNIVYPEILARARELLEKSLAARALAASTASSTAPAAAATVSAASSSASPIMCACRVMRPTPPPASCSRRRPRPRSPPLTSRTTTSTWMRRSVRRCGRATPA